MKAPALLDLRAPVIKTKGALISVRSVAGDVFLRIPTEHGERAAADAVMQWRKTPSERFLHEMIYSQIRSHSPKVLQESGLKCDWSNSGPDRLVRYGIALLFLAILLEQRKTAIITLDALTTSGSYIFAHISNFRIDVILYCGAKNEKHSIECLLRDDGMVTPSLH